MNGLRHLATAAVLLLAGAAAGCSGDLIGDSSDEDVPAISPEWRAESGDDSGDSTDDRETEEPGRTDSPVDAMFDPVPGAAVEAPGPKGIPGFVAHEWGTFTSVVASDGTYLPGLHHEEESLPAFVHQFEYSGVGESSYSKGVPRVYLPEKVNQKLETPVIYFYSDEPRQVQVDVDFPDGYITEWYPDSVEQSPTAPEKCIRCREMDREKYGLDKLADGHMKWDVSITHEDESDDMTAVPPDDIWAPSREVPRAAHVQHGGETDKFIFYRGVGQFEPPFTVEASSTSAKPEFTFTNHSNQEIPAVYLMHIKEDRGRIVELGSLGAGQGTTHQPAPKEMPKSRFVDHAKKLVKQGLMDTGLTPAESEAMVETWSRSYFEKTGYRVLYILPREWTDQMLPIDIKPEPDQLVRTLVGRVEVLPPSTEKQTLKRIRRAQSRNDSLEDIFRGGRFEEPRFRRACQLAEDSAVKTWCKSELSKLSSRVIYEAQDG